MSLSTRNAPGYRTRIVVGTVTFLPCNSITVSVTACTVRIVFRRSSPPLARTARSISALASSVATARLRRSSRSESQPAAMRPAPGPLPAQRRRAEVQVAHGNLLELVEPGARQLLLELRGIADQHDRQAVGVQIGARHALDVVHGDRVDALAKRLQLLQVETEEHRAQHLHGDRARRLDGQREAAGQVRLGVAQLALADALALQPPHLVDDQPQRFAGRLRPRVGVGDDRPGVLERVQVRRRAVGQAAIGSQHAVQPVAALAAEDLDGEIEREIVGMLARQRRVARRESPSARRRAGR